MKFEVLFTKYFTQDGRQLASGTIGCHVQAAINVLKFLHQDSSAGNYQGVPIILQLRAQVSHLCRMAGVERRTRKGSLTQDSAIFWYTNTKTIANNQLTLLFIY